MKKRIASMLAATVLQLCLLQLKQIGLETLI